MSLKTGKAPEKALQAVAEAVQNLKSSPDTEVMMAMGGSAKAAEKAEVAPPLQVYVLDLKDVGKKSLKNAQAVGWRYIVMHEDQPVAAAEVDAGGGSKVQFSHFNTGPFVEETARAIIQAEGLDEVAKKDYEARILRIPALYVMALWLHSDKDDIIIPMPPTNDSLDAKKAYSAKEFFASLAPAAKERQAFDDTPENSK